jgi:RNA polymerase sigma factor (sigma-70 family)
MPGPAAPQPDARDDRPSGRAASAGPERAQAAVSAELPALHARLGSTVRGWFIRRLPEGSTDADDLAQQTWAELTRSVAEHRYDPARSRLSTFLYAIMLNTWRQHAKRSAASRRRMAELLGEAEREGEAVAEEPAGGLAGEIEAVRAALASPASSGLTAEDGALLRLIGTGLTDRELAQRLGVAPSTAHARKQQALQRLRAHLQRVLDPDRPCPSAQDGSANQPVQKP